jgi:hypothetical protein
VDKRIVLSCAVLFLTLSATVRAERFYSGVPFHDIFPTPSGIIFPSLDSAAGINPAALPQHYKTTAMTIDYSPPPGGNGAHDYDVALASGDKSYGLGIGYQGQYDNFPTHSLYMGGGFSTSNASLGLNLRFPNLSQNLSPSTDIGMIADTKTDVLLGIVIYNLQDEAQPDLGIGFGKEKKYHFEINLILPPVSQIGQSGADFIILAATTVYASVFGISFKTSYSTATSVVNQSVSLMIDLAKKWGVLAEYDTPNRTFYGFYFLL